MWMYICVSLCICFIFPSSARAVFYPLFMFFKSIICLSHFFFIPLLALFTPYSSRKCNHVQGLRWGERGGSCGGWGGALNRTWGRGRKKHLYVYPITTPASPKSPSKRTDAHALKIATSIPPPRCVCWLQWWWGRLNNVMAFLSSVSSGLITCVSSLCVIVAGCVNEFVCPLSDCTSWLSPSPADFNPDP